MVSMQTENLFYNFDMYNMYTISSRSVVSQLIDYGVQRKRVGTQATFENGFKPFLLFFLLLLF